MKNINQFITEYIIKKKLDEPIDSEDHYTYFPNTKEELISNIDELLDKEISDFNFINTSKIRNMSNLFFYKNFNRKQKSILKDIDISKWDVSNVTNMNYMFNGCISFDGDLSNWNVSNVKDMSCMFYACRKFKNNNLKIWNTEKLEHTYKIFYGCTSLKNKPTW